MLSSACVDASRHPDTGGQGGTLAIPPARCPLSLAFCDVSYRTPQGAELIAGLSGYARPGEVLALMGESGSGKSTTSRYSRAEPGLGASAGRSTSTASCACRGAW